jgi:anaerobic ribonucleoside-triphosphate reductase activating protein
MRYAGYDDYETVNGNGGGQSVYIQGCHEPHCENCFNPETWDFNGGKEWTEEIKNKFLELADRPYIRRISLLGGECLAEENLNGVLNLVNEIRLLFGKTKTIWLYTGFTWEELNTLTLSTDNSLHLDKTDDGSVIYFDNQMLNLQKHSIWKKRRQIIEQCDVIVDGRYIDSLRNPALPYRGSENQRLIDVQKTLRKGDVVLWET